MLKRRVKTSKHQSIIFNPVQNFLIFLSLYFYVCVFMCARWEWGLYVEEGEGSDQFYCNY